MKFILQFSDPEFFVARNGDGDFEKQDDPSKAKTWDNPAAAMASPAHEFFKFDSLHVIPAYDGDNPAEYDALLREGEESAHLDCGCLLYRPDPDCEKEVAILFCPLHAAADKGAKALAVLGRLHDGLSDMIENSRLTEGAIPDDYQWLVSLLVNESLPLFPGDERVKPAVPVEVIEVVPAGDPDSECAREAVGFNVWICIEAVDAEGDAVGNDIDPGFGSCRTFDSLAGAEAFAKDVYVYSQGELVVASSSHATSELIDRVFSKVNDETETWRAEPIGADLAYLAWAIAEGPGKGFVEWDLDDSTMVSFKHWFAAGDPVWQFIKEA